MKKHLRKLRSKRVLIPVGVLLLLFVGIALFFLGNPGVPAQVADNVLRPLIGEQATLQLESYYNNTSDQIKEIKSHFIAPKAPLLSLNDSIHLNNTGSLDLSPLVLQTAFAPLTGEGQWQEVAQPLFPDRAVMARTFIRPDETRSYAIVTIMQYDMHQLGINTQAGQRYPGGKTNPGPGYVPLQIQQEGKLVAAFNGGFQERDGHYGMVVGNDTYVPLRTGLATLVMKEDGTFSMIDYEGQSFDPHVVSIRQNGPYLVHNGQITQYVEAGRDTWGRTTTNSMYTWRSGLGITKNGNLLYAVGGSLVPQTLAKALQAAGAVDAMQLDINPVWVRNYIYTPQGNGTYTSKRLIPDMVDAGSLYLKGYEKDFFYLYKRQ